MRIITADQGTEEWMQARTGVPSGSRYADVMAKGRDGGKSATRQGYITELALEILTGVRIGIPTTPAMLAGTEREPLARAAYEARTDNLVNEIGFCMHDSLSTGVSPDGLIDKAGLIEIKSPLPKTHLEYMKLDAGKCPSAYKWQVQGQIWITERDWCDFVSFCPEFPPSSQLVVRRVTRDDKAIKDLEAELIKFLDELRQEVAFIQAYQE